MSLQSVMAVCEKELRDINVPIRKVEKITFNESLSTTVSRRLSEGVRTAAKKIRSKSKSPRK